MDISRLGFIRGLLGLTATAVVPSVVAKTVIPKTYCIMSCSPQNLVFRLNDGTVVHLSSSYNGISSYTEVSEEQILKLHNVGDYKRMVANGFVAEFVRDGNEFNQTEWALGAIKKVRVCE